MKFTKEEAFEKLKGYLTNNGKKPLRMSELSINKQLEYLMPLIASEEMELDDFIGKVKDTFSVINSNVEKDNADFVKQWKKDHPVEPPIDKPDKPDKPTPDDATAALLKRIEELEKKEADRSKEAVLAQKKKDLLKAMKEKGINTVNFLKAFPRKKRLEIVDILRGHIPIPIDYKELSMIAQVLDIDKDDLYNMWEKRMKQVLETNGMNIYSNAALVNAMFDCAKKYIDLG